MKGNHLLQHLLEVEAPWHVVDVSFDARQRLVDVSVGILPERTGWFSRAKPAVVRSAKDRVWRHVNMGTWRCVIRVPSSAGESMAGLPWCGEEDIPFSRAMSQQVANFLMQGFKLQEICNLLDVELTDLWRFKYNLDHGKIGLSTVKPAGPVAPSGLRPERSADKDSLSRVPDLSDKAWEKLLDGTLHIEIRYLSLKLILTKLRNQMNVIEDPDVRMLKVQEIYRYFLRNEKMLAHELTQLRGS